MPVCNVDPRLPGLDSYLQISIVAVLQSAVLFYGSAALARRLD